MFLITKGLIETSFASTFSEVLSSGGVRFTDFRTNLMAKTTP